MLPRDSIAQPVGSISDVSAFLNWPNPTSRTVVQESTKPLGEMITRNLSVCKRRLAGKANNLNAICEPNV
jgi:hypothetical protein